jgi:hypothetical protein
MGKILKTNKKKGFSPQLGEKIINYDDIQKGELLPTTSFLNSLYAFFVYKYFP